MQAEMNRHGGDIVASSFDHSSFVTLRFKQGANEMTLYLDKKMAKAAATIVVVFNEFASGGSISDANDRVIRETDDEANAAASMKWVNAMRAGLGLPPIDYGKPDLPWQFKVSDSNTGPIIGPHPETTINGHSWVPTGGANAPFKIGDIEVSAGPNASVAFKVSESNVDEPDPKLAAAYDAFLRGEPATEIHRLFYGDPDKFALGSTIDLDAAMKVEGGK